ncbi:hypothetical protein HPB51_017960 [Rhipicephalus microplus]|uniref:Uncharacterized protein n=1 Tax=Rhipicephalus microplus TaxID=6941 RepID=A0A9J6EPR0_RHIMP|nr:hypothetical protein HPB51_017960 [Rhipicephalus microplus]
MSVRMLLIAIVALVAPRYFEKVKAHAVGNLTEHLPDGLPTTQSAGVISASVSVPATDSTVDVRVDAIVFWIGCTLAMLLLASCAACHICRCSERRRNSSRRGRRGPSREPVPQVETSRTAVHPEMRPRTGIVFSPPTYGTARLPFPSPGASTQDRPPISPWGTHTGRVGYYDLRSSVLDQRREEDDFGYQSQPLQPASNGLPSHESGAFGSTLRPPVAPWRDLGSPYPALIGLHRSAPPANDFRGYQW